MHTQRRGQQSRPRNNDHTRWAKDEQELSWPAAAFIAAVLLLVIIGLFVPTN